MPILVFQCLNKDCAHEFDMLIHLNAGLGTLKYRWCKQCNKVTNWAKVESKMHGLYHVYPDGTENIKALICCACGGDNELLVPFIPYTKVEESDMITLCPKCNQPARNILKVTHYGKDDIGHSSIRFRFNYLEN